MFNKKLALMLLAGATLGFTACDQQTTSAESTETSTVDGVTTESTTEVEATTDSHGVTTTETSTETTVDPAGAMNKETVEESHTETTEPAPH